MIYKIIAETPLRYRIMDSFPIEGFKVEAGKSFRVLGSVMKELQIKKGKYRIEREQ